MSVVYDLSACCCSQDVPCCESGTVPNTLNADLTSTCAAFNGSMTLTWNAGLSQWVGTWVVDAENDDFCGYPCSQKFVFYCFDSGETQQWRFAAGDLVSGCDDETAGDQQCVAGGQRTHAAGSACDTLDLTMTVGNLAVSAGCSCCSNVAITVRVYV